MKTIIAFAALASMFLFSQTAMAWDELITNDTSTIKEPLHTTINAKVMWRTASKVFDSNSKTQDLAKDMTYMSIPLRGKYVINEFVQTFAIIQLNSFDDGVNSNMGIGDLWLGAKWAVRPEGNITVRGAINLPFGDDKKGLGHPGGYGLDVGFMTGKTVGSIVLNGQFGLRYGSEDTDTKIEPGIGVYLAGKAGYSFSEQVIGHAALEFMSWGEQKLDNKAQKKFRNQLA